MQDQSNDEPDLIELGAVSKETLGGIDEFYEGPDHMI